MRYFAFIVLGFLLLTPASTVSATFDELGEQCATGVEMELGPQLVGLEPACRSVIDSDPAATPAKFVLARILTFKGQYEEAYALASDAARVNIPRAFTIMAGLKLEGKGVPQDIPGAVALYLDAANLKDVPAINWLFSYYVSVGDQRSALPWAVNIANRGLDPWMQWYVGFSYFDGKGTAIDLLKAREWFEKALANVNYDGSARQKEIMGMSKFALATFYLSGQAGVQPDINRAITFLKEADEFGYPGAPDTLRKVEDLQRREADANAVIDALATLFALVASGGDSDQVYEPAPEDSTPNYACGGAMDAYAWSGKGESNMWLLC